METTLVLGAEKNEINSRQRIVGIILTFILYNGKGETMLISSFESLNCKKEQACRKTGKILPRMLRKSENKGLKMILSVTSAG